MPPADLKDVTDFHSDSFKKMSRRRATATTDSGLNYSEKLRPCRKAYGGWLLANTKDVTARGVGSALERLDSPVPQNQPHRLRRAVAQCLFGSVALGVVTFVCFRVQFNLATAAFLYLMVIICLSLQGSFISSAVVS